MDLLTAIANEFNIPIIRKNQKIWFFRTKSGKYYYDFKTNDFIALGWDRIGSDLITSTRKTKEGMKAEIEKLYQEEKRPGLIFSRMDIFYNRMQVGDLVLIPDEGTKTVSVGIVGDFIGELNRKLDNGKHAQCAFLHRRAVSWQKQIEVWQDIYLFKVLRAQQTISDITDAAKLVFRNLFPIYISGHSIHLTFQKSTADNLSLASNVELLSNLLEITDVVARLYGKESFRNDLCIKTAVGSPGILEIIMPNSPVAAISVTMLLFMIRFAVGKEKTADGASSTGLIALVTKCNELINDHVNRKKQLQKFARLTQISG